METPSAEIEAAADAWMQNAFGVARRVADLCADEAEFNTLLCDRRSRINATGAAGERFVQDNYPTCVD